MKSKTTRRVLGFIAIQFFFSLTVIIDGQTTLDNSYESWDEQSDLSTTSNKRKPYFPAPTVGDLSPFACERQRAVHRRAQKPTPKFAVHPLLLRRSTRGCKRKGTSPIVNVRESSHQQSLNHTETPPLRRDHCTLRYINRRPSAPQVSFFDETRNGASPILDYAAGHCSAAPKRTVYCNKDANTEEVAKQGRKKKGKALVLFNMPFSGSDTRPTEWDNLAHLLRTGLHAPGQGTLLFDEVVYVFFRINPEVKRVTLFHEHKNLIFLQIPIAACDLCAHLLVLEFLGLESAVGYDPPEDGAPAKHKKGEPLPMIETDYLLTNYNKMMTEGLNSSSPPSSSLEERRNTTAAVGDEENGGKKKSAAWWKAQGFKSLVFQNAGVRGPFLDADDNGDYEGIDRTHSSSHYKEEAISWIDIVSLGRPDGNDQRAIFLEDELSSLPEKREFEDETSSEVFKTVTGSMFSLRGSSVSMHTQGYWFTVPISVLDMYMDNTKRRCDGVSMDNKNRKRECAYFVEVHNVMPFIAGEYMSANVNFHWLALNQTLSRRKVFESYGVSPSVSSDPTEVKNWLKSRKLKVPPMHDNRFLTQSPLGGIFAEASAPSSRRNETKIRSSRNPNSFPIDPCASVFLKYGGIIFDFMPDITSDVIGKLTVGMQGKINSGTRRRLKKIHPFGQSPSHGRRKKNGDKGKGRSTRQWEKLKRDLSSWAARNEFTFNH